MSIYYIKKALGILRENGVMGLLNALIRFAKNVFFPTLFYQTIRLDLTTKSIKRPVTGPLMRKYLKHKYNHIELYEHIYLNPCDVEYMLTESKFVSFKYKNRLPDSWIHTPEKGSFHPQLYTGLIIGGDWDKYRRKHEYDKVYRGLKQHYHGSIPWEATVWGQEYKNEEYRLNKENKLKKKIISTEDLYKSIKDKGLLPPNEFYDKKNYPLRRPFGITVNIGRQGEIIFNNLDGHRRLAIAKILDLDQIPVLVVVRHEEWQQLRQDIHKNGLSEERRDLQDHPDLQNILN